MSEVKRKIDWISKTLEENDINSMPKFYPYVHLSLIKHHFK